jgi:hypothetical protein
MINVSQVKSHSHAAGKKGANQKMSPPQKGALTKIRLRVDAPGMPVRIVMIKAAPADCPQAST